MQRACFRLCEMEGFTRTEVAQMMELSDSTVRVHLHRARLALRDSLGSLVDIGSDPTGGARGVDDPLGNAGGEGMEREAQG